MQIEEIYNLIEKNKPRIIYISGKTSTGKSTLAKRLSADFAYEIIELDEVVNHDVIAPLKIKNQEEVFLEVYRGRDRIDWINLFVKAVDAKVRKFFEQNKKVIIEGAIANHLTLKEVFKDFEFTFIYLHPKDLNKYVQNLTNRFVATTEINRQGLPFAFWQLIDEHEFENFCKSRKLNVKLTASIQQYAVKSKEESEQRLSLFKKYFEKIKVVEV